MIDCTITGIAQELDFEQNTTVTYLTLVLPNGSSLRVAVDDEAAATVMEQHVQVKGQPKSAVRVPPAVRKAASAPTPAPVPEDSVEPEEIAPAPAVVEDVVSEDGTPTHVFGGQDAPSDNSAMSEEEQLLLKEGSPTVVAAETAPAVKVTTRRNNKRVVNGKLVVPSRTVPAAEKGYPVVPNAGVDASTFTGGRDPDEDGVGSV
jgi:hypothetical protein